MFIPHCNNCDIVYGTAIWDKKCKAPVINTVHTESLIGDGYM